MKTTQRQAYLWMLAGAASFSVMSFTAHELRNACSWQWIAVVRTALALVLTVALARSSGIQLVLWRPASLWMRSLAGSVALLANFFSMTHYAISEVLAISNMFPLWVAVLSWPVLGQLPRATTWAAVACGVAGVFLLQLEAPAVSDHPANVLPIATAVIASLASAVAMLGLHRLKTVHSAAVVAHFSGVSLIASLAVLPSSLDGPSPWNHSATIAGLIVLGIAGTAGQLCLTKAFASGPPTQVSVVALSQVVFAMLLEKAVHNRQFTLTTLVGLALVVGPTAWVLLRRRDVASD